MVTSCQSRQLPVEISMKTLTDIETLETYFKLSEENKQAYVSFGEYSDLILFIS